MSDDFFKNDSEEEELGFSDTMTDEDDPTADTEDDDLEGFHDLEKDEESY